MSTLKINDEMRLGVVICNIAVVNGYFFHLVGGISHIGDIVEHDGAAVYRLKVWHIVLHNSYMVDSVRFILIQKVEDVNILGVVIAHG